jgi:hypothetical protein
MSKIKVNLPCYPVNGKQVSFISPCSSINTECLIVNDVEYSVVDADGVSVAGLKNVWNAGAMVSAILNVDTRTAFIQNANTNTYIEGQFQAQTQKLKLNNSATREDTIPFYDESAKRHCQITFASLREALGVASATIDVTTCADAEVVCSNGTTSLTASGSTQFTLPNTGVWTVTATLGGKTASATVNATGAMLYAVDLRIPNKITVDSTSAKTIYFSGETVDTSGFKVTATYVDGTTADVTDDCTFSPTTTTADTTELVVSYSNAGLSTTANVPITIRALSSIAITTAPNKTKYKYGELFIGTGMVVTATYSDGYTCAVTGWTVSPTRSLILSDKKVTVSYTENGVTKTTTQAITVSNYLASIEVTTAPTTTEYYSQETFDASGMVVTAVYADGSTKVVTDYTYSPKTMTSSVTAITISYTEGGVTEKTTQAVSVTGVSATLESNSWATIRKMSDEGKAANYWNVGDVKSITINGAVGNTTFSKLSLRTFIIGIDHNSQKEGANRIHFQIGKIGTKDVCLCDSKYDSTGENPTSSAGAFTMNTKASNSGGWNSSNMRNYILGNNSTPAAPTSGSLLAALPSGLRAVMKPVTKYTDNAGNKSKVSDAITATTDYLFLLSVFEVLAVDTSTNPYEKNSQAQYAYYKAGNSFIKYKHDATGENVYWWSRSNNSLSSGEFLCISDRDGSTGIRFQGSNCSSGIAPGFCV